MSADGALTAGLDGGRLAASRALQLGFVVALLAVWQFAAASGAVNAFFLPAPLAVFRTLGEIIANGEAWEEFRVTFFEFIAACPIAAAAGTLAGYLVSRGDYSTRVFEPVFAGLFAVPLIVFYPISVLYFGIGPGSKIAHGAIFGFFPICLNTIQGFSRVDPILARLAQSLGATPWQTFRRILLPAAFPAILGGYRLGFMLTFLAIIGGETIASLSGLGHRIVWYAEGLETVRMFAYVLLVIAAAAAMNALLSLLEKSRGWRP